MTAPHGTFAAKTDVPPERSRAEIERTLRRYGADSFMYGYDGDRAMIAFKLAGRLIRVFVPLPERRAHRTQAQFDQAVRQRWRVLALVVKAKLEAVQVGLSTLEQEFLSGVMLPDGSTVGEWIAPQIEAAYSTGRMPALLPALGSGS